jgi:hypothetical protein
MSAEYTAVCCDCGRSNAVQPPDMGKRRGCTSCGFVILMPRLDEFQQNCVRETYPTMLKKVAARIEDGRLPGVEDCQGCDTPSEREVNVLVQCEQSREETVGGTGVWAVLLAMLLGMVGGFFILLRPDHGATYFYGRDTDIRVPVRLCSACQRRLSARRLWPAVAVAILGLALAVVVGLLAGWWWVVVVLVTLPVVGLLLQTTRRRRVEEGRRLLRAVPDYAELLQTYRSAEVVVPSVK